MADLSTLIEYTNYFDQFKTYRRNLFSSILGKLGWDAKANEDPLIAMLRPMILSIMGKSDHSPVIDEARRRFNEHLNGNLIDPNIRGAVYAIVSRHGDETTQEALKKLYRDGAMTEEKVRLLRSMGQSADRQAIEKTLEFIFEGVRAFLLAE